VNCVITIKKKGQLFFNGVLDLQQHGGTYSKMCYLGERGILSLSLSLSFCFVLFLKILNSMTTRELWIDLLMFPFFSLIVTFCSDCNYHYLPSSWYLWQNWCMVSVWGLGL